eukprot:5866334-Alexandrium_andersonii.AAC.1
MRATRAHAGAQLRKRAEPKPRAARARGVVGALHAAQARASGRGPWMRGRLVFLGEGGRPTIARNL